MIKNITKEYRTIFYISVATKVGVGSIIGTTIAIYTGGGNRVYILDMDIWTYYNFSYIC